MAKHKSKEQYEKEQPAPTFEKTFLVITRKAALGNGTRKPGFVLGEIKDPKNLSAKGIILSECVKEVEIINALANPDVYKVQM